MYYYYEMTDLNKANKKSIKDIYKSIDKKVQKFNSYRVYNKSAELAYYLIIGLLTVLVTLVYAAHFIPNIIQNVDRQFLSLLPENIKDLILEALYQIKVPKSISVISATSLMSIWFASRAMHSMMMSFDEIYGGKKKHKVGFQSKVLAIVFTITLYLVFILVFVMTLIQSSITSFIEENFNVEFFSFVTDTNISTLISISVLIIVFTLMYRYLPTREVKMLGSIPGAIFTTTAWVIMSRGFTYYVNNINNFSWILGSFGSIFVFLIWIYYSALFILLGAMINVGLMSLFANKKKKKTEDKPQS